jgi:hypothetical protein
LNWGRGIDLHGQSFAAAISVVAMMVLNLVYGRDGCCFEWVSDCCHGGFDSQVRLLEFVGIETRIAGDYGDGL